MMHLFSTFFSAKREFAANPNWQELYRCGGFGNVVADTVAHIFKRPRKSWTVAVYHDWDGHRLVKVVNGRVVAVKALPRNWKDNTRHDGRKWDVDTVVPSAGLHLSPCVDVTLTDKLYGRTAKVTL